MNAKPAAIMMSIAVLAGGGAAGGVVAATRDAGAPSVTTTTVTAAASTGTAVTASSTESTSLTAGEIYKSASKGVVDLVVGGSGSSGSAEGSGFVVDKKGDIITNAHVVDGATTVRVTFSDGTKATGRVLGTDAASDLAVVRVSVAASKLHPLTLAGSGDVEVGDGVLAIGSPFGLSQTLTTGIVSALNRTITSPSGATIGGTIQTDTSINPGNSGGPLIDTSGEVVGVNAQIESDSGGNDGVGFAIPSDTVRRVAAALIAGETVQHPQLGVQIEDATSGGVKLAAVTAGGAAAEAGLKAGDTITAIDGTAVSGADALASLIASHQPGDRLRVAFTRDGAAKAVTATLSAANASSAG